MLHNLLTYCLQVYFREKCPFFLHHFSACVKITCPIFGSDETTFSSWFPFFDSSEKSSDQYITASLVETLKISIGIDRIGKFEKEDKIFAHYHCVLKLQVEVLNKNDFKKWYNLQKGTLRTKPRKFPELLTTLQFILFDIVFDDRLSSIHSINPKLGANVVE